MVCIVGGLCAPMGHPGAYSQRPPEPAAPKAGPEFSGPEFSELWTEIRKLGDWEDQAEPIQETVNRYWEENRWNTEADLFAKKTALEVSRIPPWNMTGRMGKFTDLLTERYDFTDQQRLRVESSLYAEFGWFVIKNHRVIFSQTRDYVSMRTAGKPFTSELISRWTRESEPLVTDLRERFDRVVESLDKTLTPQQREILKRDLRSLHKREAFVMQLRDRWKQGRWQPRDWGLENDPAYARWRPDRRLEERLRRRAAAEAAERRRALFQAVDENAWERYVREFVARHQLDDAQKRSAYSILHELQTRAGDYRTIHRDELRRIPRRRLIDHPLGEPIKRMFEELKTRMLSIPTAAQRAAAARSTR